MKIFEIVVPGETLKGFERYRADRMEALLFELEIRFFEANVALNLFEAAKQQIQAAAHVLNPGLQRRQDLMAHLALERGLSRGTEISEDLRFEANVQFKREQWANGKEPGDFSQRRAFVAAHAFLCAVDGFDKALGFFAHIPNVPEAVRNLHGRLQCVFHSLRGAGAAMHSGMPMSRKLHGTRYGCVMPDGRFWEVEVTEASLDQLRQIFQATLDAFAWEGPKRHLPLM